MQQRLRSYAVLDTPRDAVFDRVVFTAAQMFRVPIAVIGLRDRDRLWFKSQVGLQRTEVPWTMSLCSEIEGDEVLAVEDASRDSRFALNPLVVGPPFIRFYAGTRLITPDGLHVGSVCVADRAPKTMLTRQIWQLSQLAQSVVASLEARRPLPATAMLARG